MGKDLDDNRDVSHVVSTMITQGQGSKLFFVLVFSRGAEPIKIYSHIELQMGWPLFMRSKVTTRRGQIVTLKG